MKILFMGTPDFAAESLKALISDNRDVAAVISQPNKPKNRGMKVVNTPVFQVAEDAGIPVFQPETLKNGAIEELLKDVNPDIIVVVAYGKLLPEYVLNYPKYGCINIHGSLLPKYRGAAPIQFSILKGESETGVTSMYMAKGMDTGDMILKKSIAIKESDNAGILHDKLATLGAELLLETLDAIENGTAPREVQNETEATYATQLTKEMGNVCWENDASDIINLIRGLDPWPCAYSFANGKRFKIYTSKKEEQSGKAGEILEISDSLLVACGSGSIRIFEVQFENKKRMRVGDFVRGNAETFKVGNILGE